MAELILPSFERLPFSPPLPEGGDHGLRAAKQIEETAGGVPVWVLAGSYRLPDHACRSGQHPLAALVVVAIGQDGFVPLVRRLTPAELSGAPASPAPSGDQEGAFALDLWGMFGLRDHSGWFTVVCSVDRWVSAPVAFEALGGG